jgi:tRNA pseudouridine38-40 synthase
MNTLDEPAALRRARLVLAYDGAAFHGFAENPGLRTVLGDLRGAMERICQVPLTLVGAGRTDAGVHAWGQVVSGDLPADVALDGLVRRVNRMCGPAIAVRSAEWCSDPRFSARFSATYRHYRFDVWNAPFPEPSMAATTWHVRQPLSLWTMRLACDPLIGEHDFSSFCRRPKVDDGRPEPSMRRRVISASWREVSDEHHVAGPDEGLGLVRFEIRANAFCHQMVRSIVGTLVDVGLGRLHAGEIHGLMLSRDRTAVRRVAPPQGLTLWEVGYPR